VNLVDPNGAAPGAPGSTSTSTPASRSWPAFNRTGHAERLEKLTDDQVIDEAMAVIETFYGGPRSRPVMQRSHWGADPFTCGTLAYVPPGASSADFVTLGLPVGRLGFAGDSTVAEVHGNRVGCLPFRCPRSDACALQHGAHAHEGLDLDAMDPRQIVHSDPEILGGPRFSSARAYQWTR